MSSLPNQGHFGKSIHTTWLTAISVAFQAQLVHHQTFRSSLQAYSSMHTAKTHYYTECLSVLVSTSHSLALNTPAVEHGGSVSGPWAQHFHTTHTRKYTHNTFWQQRLAKSTNILRTSLTDGVVISHSYYRPRIVTPRLIAEFNTKSPCDVYCTSLY